MKNKTKERLGTLFGNGAAGLFTLGAYDAFGTGAALGVAGVWAALLAIGFHDEAEEDDD